MPSTGGRLGWNEPPPAATTTTLARNTSSASVVEAEAAVFQLLQRGDHAAEMELRPERRDLLHQIVVEALPGDHRKARNVVDRLFRIELGALPARPVENVDDMAFEIEQPELEHGEEADTGPPPTMTTSVSITCRPYECFPVQCRESRIDVSGAGHGGASYRLPGDGVRVLLPGW